LAAAAAANKETGDVAVDGEKKISGDSTADAGVGDKVDGTEEKKETVVGDSSTAPAEVAAPTEGVQKTDTDMTDADMSDAAANKRAGGAAEAAAAAEGETKHARGEGDGDKNEDEPSAKKQKVVV